MQPEFVWFTYMVIPSFFDNFSLHVGLLFTITVLLPKMHPLDSSEWECVVGNLTQFLSENIYILLSLLKNVFAGYIILGWQVFL